MRMVKFSRLLLLALALLLLGGQQAALAHMLGHAMGEAAAKSLPVAQQGDDDHGAALTLSHVCTTCLALDTFAAPLPTLPPLACAAGAAAAPPAAAAAAPAAAPPRRYAARAPPLPL